MYLVGRILSVVGLGAALFGGFQVSLLLRGTSTPEKVTIAQLGAENGTNNVHLTVTEFQFGDGPVIEEEENGRWRRVWIPLLTPDGQWTERPVVLHTNRVSNQGELNRVVQRTSVTGIVSNFMQSLGKNQQEQFAISYPGQNLNGAICIELDGRFPSPFVAYPMAILGVISFILGIGMLFGRFPAISRRSDEPAV